MLRLGRTTTTLPVDCNNLKMKEKVESIAIQVSIAMLQLDDTYSTFYRKTKSRK
jgi:hypothetical protein